MLFIDDEKITADKLADMFGVNLASLSKKSAFELDKSKVFKDRANGNIPKVNKGYEQRAKFRTLKPGTLERVEIRYATTQTPVKGSNGTAFDYKPHYIAIEGSTFAFNGNIDLALFMFLNPANTLSPCRESGRKYSNLYEFIDDKVRSIKRLSNITKKTQALKHAESSDIATLALIAKSLKVGGVDDMSDETLRVTMMEYADNPQTTDKYISAIESKVSLLEGRILNLIDKGVLVNHANGGTSQWKWKSGAREGEVVGNTVMFPNEPKSYIVNYLLSNLELFERDIVDTNDSLTAQQKASEFLRSKGGNDSEVASRGPQTVDSEYIEKLSGVELPDYTVFSNVRDYVSGNGYKIDMAKVKIMKELMEEGQVTASNVREYLSENFEKKAQ